MTRYQSLYSHGTISHNNPRGSISSAGDSVTLFSTDLDSSGSDNFSTYETDEEGEEDDDELESDASFSSISILSNPHHKPRTKQARIHNQRASFANMRTGETAITCSACGGMIPLQSKAKSKYIHLSQSYPSLSRDFMFLGLRILTSDQ